jgi:hypothetical protein
VRNQRDQQPLILSIGSEAHVPEPAANRPRRWTRQRCWLACAALAAAEQDVLVKADTRVAWQGHYCDGLLQQAAPGSVPH